MAELDQVLGCEYADLHVVRGDSRTTQPVEQAIDQNDLPAFVNQLAVRLRFARR